ncbi:hypothetical protein LPJ81_003231, partial [Coemansia sp. IMI 209127]
MGKGSRSSGKRRAGHPPSGKSASRGSRKKQDVEHTHATSRPQSPTRRTPPTDEPYARQPQSPLRARPSDSRITESGGSTYLSDGATHSQASENSRRSHSASNRSQVNLSSVMSHYMQNVDGMSDIIANQYYGNMDVLRESANRQPRPINSTLPLFSPSVISGRRVSRVRSSNGSDTSANRQHAHVPGNEAVSYAGPTILFDGAAGVSADARPGSMYKNRSTSAILQTGNQADEGLGTMEQGARMHRRKTDTGVVAN